MTAIDFSAFVDELATVSGETILPFFRTALSVEDKGRHGSFDPVTAADHAAETAMRALIRRTFPDHGIIGEEFGDERADAEYVWVLDPIDGTKSFISGMPVWGTLIALTRFGEPVFGVMNQPFTGERFSGDGGAAQLIAARPASATCACGPARDLSEAVLFTTSPLLMNSADRADLRQGRGGGAALALRRRLLRLLHAGGRPRRSRDRDRAQALRRAAADPDHRRRRRRHHHLGERVALCTAGASSPPATSACTRRRWSC